MVGNELKEDNRRIIIHALLARSGIDFPLRKDEYKLLGFFIERIADLVEVYVKKDREYQHAWRNMPWQSCVIRAREKLFRLLSMKDVNAGDIFEESGDSIVYLLFSLYQFEYGFISEPTSRKGKAIEELLGQIDQILKIDDSNMEFVSHASLDTWVDATGGKMTTEEVLHELRQGANVKIGNHLILGRQGNGNTTFIMVDGEGKVLGFWNPLTEAVKPLKKKIGEN